MGWMNGVQFLAGGRDFFLFTTKSRPALQPKQPPVQWILGVLTLVIKQPGHEADYSPQFSAEIKNVWSYTSTIPYVFMAWCLVKHSDNFTSTQQC